MREVIDSRKKIKKKHRICVYIKDVKIPWGTSKEKCSHQSEAFPGKIIPSNRRTCASICLIKYIHRWLLRIRFGMMNQ
jgi:hypothetical protein